MKICPNCGKVLAYNSYFGAYICDSCNWEDASRGKTRNMGRSSIPKQSVKRHQSATAGKKIAFAVSSK